MLNSKSNLKNAKILVIGTGGLGSPVIMILARSGIGHLGIVDYDRVEISNLQRQILHTTSRTGQQKTGSCQKTLSVINPDLRVVVYPVKITVDNVGEIIQPYDLVIDCVDNFPTRYIVNDACYFARIPMIESGVLRFEGQVTTFIRDQGPCLRCIFPNQPPPGTVPTTQEVGILGPVAGLLGSIQAYEAIKFFSDTGPALAGKLWIINTLSRETRIIRWPKNDKCQLCGVTPSIKSVGQGGPPAR